jgi:2-dehydro-3-deoxyphosphogluconate aldolase/(4S)-4-hydroxy-2-oxoglutarate aldolase
MDSQFVYDWMARDGIVAGMRGDFHPAVALELVEILMDEGIHIFEFTMNSVQPIEAMQAVKKQFGDKVCAGMGTVLDVETAKRVLGAGANFVVSPSFQPDVVEAIMKPDIFIAPGVITPTEAVNAWSMGVKMLKIFPIGTLGLDYFKAIFGPLNHLKFMCNGGMTADNAGEFIKAGAVTAGMAAWLTGDGTWTESKLRSRARLVKNAIAVARGEEMTTQEA